VGRSYAGCNLNLASAAPDCKDVYVWNMIWPDSDTLQLGGYISTPKSITLLSTGEKIDFVKDGHRIILKNLPKECPDKHAGIAVFKLEFDEHAKYKWVSYYPQMHLGVNYAGDLVQ
jgi:hypothetical protein